MLLFQQSEQMDKELTANGVDYVFIFKRGAGHGVDAFRGNDDKIYDPIIAFASKHMK